MVARKISRDIGLELGNNFTYHLGADKQRTSGTLEDYARDSGIKYTFRTGFELD